MDQILFFLREKWIWSILTVPVYGPNISIGTICFITPFPSVFGSDCNIRIILHSYVPASVVSLDPSMSII